jgi:hypothetical protein
MLWGRKVPIPMKPLLMSPELKRILKTYQQVLINRPTYEDLAAGPASRLAYTAD